MQKYIVAVLLVLTGGWAVADIVPAAVAAPAPVTLTEDDNAYTLANGVVTARVIKHTGDLISLKYKQEELLGQGSGHPAGYWSHAPTRNSSAVSAITIDPKTNHGERAECSIKGMYQGSVIGRGPGGGTSADIEIRYALGQGDSGLYTYTIFTHRTNYPQTAVGEARFAAKLNAKVFDFMTIDANRRKEMPRPEDWDKGTEMNMKEARRMNTGIYKGQVEHKYDYSAIQYEIPAFGWSSSNAHIGLWFVNPSIEYLSGGATKVELTGHLDNGNGADPTLLNYWRGSHYGGSSCALAEGEEWTKVVGPFLIYCNSAASNEGMWQDALAKAKQEADAWPYDWVSGVDYPHKDQRSTVSGQILLTDTMAPAARMSNILVGLSAPDYLPPRFSGGRFFSRGGGGEDDTTNTNTPSGASARTNDTPRFRGGFGAAVPRLVDWQMDAKYYEFWVRADDQGRFTVPKVRPGNYTLHVIADGVLGEFALSNVTVNASQTLVLGKLKWQPVHYGKPVWDIGIPDRTAAEFFHGDDYWHWGLYQEYPKEFPNDVNFTIGKSDPRKDWNYCQVPRGDGNGRGSATTWSVNFDLPSAPHGKATLRLAFAATSARNIQVTVNNEVAGSTGPLQDTATIRRDGIRGYWYERDVIFDAALMKAGNNVLKLTVPAGGVMSGVEYDYLRLELDESTKAPSSEQTKL